MVRRFSEGYSLMKKRLIPKNCVLLGKDEESLFRHLVIEASQRSGAAVGPEIDIRVASVIGEMRV